MMNCLTMEFFPLCLLEKKTSSLLSEHLTSWLNLICLHRDHDQQIDVLTFREQPEGLRLNHDSK